MASSKVVQVFVILLKNNNFRISLKANRIKIVDYELIIYNYFESLLII